MLLLDQVPLDRDFIQTREDFFFCIVGYVHPSDRIQAYLKYIPSDFDGKWKFRNQNLRRVLPFYSAQAVLNTFQFLESNYPQYLFNDKYTDMVFSAVPLLHIKHYFSTKRRLKEILELPDLDPLQKKLKTLISMLSELSDLPLSAFGITGSILLNIHSRKFSDLDITVHGFENSIKIKRLMKDIFEQGNPHISRLEKPIAERWQEDKAKRFGLSKEDGKLLFERKWNMGLFQNTRFSIHPIKNPNEIDEKYGDKTFIQKGNVELQAVVTDSEALFLPSKYRIAEVKITKGEKVDNLRELISYEGLFDASVEKNEFIKAKGQLELVKDNILEIEYYRVVIGSNKGTTDEFILKIL